MTVWQREMVICDGGREREWESSSESAHILLSPLVLFEGITRDITRESLTKLATRLKIFSSIFSKAEILFPMTDAVRKSYWCKSKILNKTQ